MVVNTARRVREGLAELIRLANDAATSTSDLRVLLGECKTFGGQLAVLQADAAASIAGRERHGDSGVGVLAQAAGLSRREAAGQVQTAERLQAMPAVRDAVEAGQIPIANAKTLARASGRTSTGQVEGDVDLLEKAAGMSPEHFAKEAGRWVVKRQHDGGEGEYRRQRARRRLCLWNGDDGMVHLRGELDPVTGAKVHKRFLLETERLRRLDLHGPDSTKRSVDQRMADALETLTSQGSIYSNAENNTHQRRRSGSAEARTGGSGEARTGSSSAARTGSGGEARMGSSGEARTGSGGEARTDGSRGEARTGNGGEARTGSGGEARMGNSGEARTGGSGEARMGSSGEARMGGGGEARTGGGGEARTGSSSGEARMGGGGEARTSGSSGASVARRDANAGAGLAGPVGGDGRLDPAGSEAGWAEGASSSQDGDADADGGAVASRGRCECGGRPSADITIVQHLSSDGTDAFAEIAGGGVIPRSVLEEHFCNARISGVVFSVKGVPLWHGHAKRLASKAQMNALRARYGACGGCGADMWICQGHHIRPVCEGGPTNIDNMMLLCWACHQKVHHHQWRVVPDGRGLHTIKPPQRTRHGPAHADDEPPAHTAGRSQGLLALR